MKFECPKCVLTPLEARTENGVTVDVCPKCGGCWYEIGELEKFVAGKEQLQKALNAGLLNSRPTSTRCAKCDQPMTNGGLVSLFLRVDQCQSCKGIWLDKAELRILRDVMGEQKSS